MEKVTREMWDKLVKHANPDVIDTIARVRISRPDGSRPDGQIGYEGARLIIEELATYGFQII